MLEEGDVAVGLGLGIKNTFIERATFTLYDGIQNQYEKDSD
jgi:hypothetical protein